MNDNGRDKNTEITVASTEVILDPTKALHRDKDPEEDLATASESTKNRWLSIFIQLAKSKRFIHFVENNYDIKDFIDDEKKTITTLVIERPVVVGPAITVDQLRHMMKVLTNHRCKKPSDALHKIMEYLGQKKASQVLLASHNDLKELERTLEKEKKS